MTTEVVALTLDLLEQIGETDPLINSRRMSGPAYGWLLDGRPVVAAGLGRVVGREFLAWCVIKPEVRASKLLIRRLTREIRTRYPIIRDLIKAEVVQADTRDDPMFTRWLQELDMRRLPIAHYGWAKHG